MSHPRHGTKCFLALFYTQRKQYYSYLYQLPEVFKVLPLKISLVLMSLAALAIIWLLLSIGSTLSPLGENSINTSIPMVKSRQWTSPYKNRYGWTHQRSLLHLLSLEFYWKWTLVLTFSFSLLLFWVPRGKVIESEFQGQCWVLHHFSFTA